MIRSHASSRAYIMNARTGKRILQIEKGTTLIMYPGSYAQTVNGIYSYRLSQPEAGFIYWYYVDSNWEDLDPPPPPIVPCGAPSAVTIRKGNTLGGSSTSLLLPPNTPIKVFWSGATVGDGIKGYEVHASTSTNGVNWSAFKKVASCTTNSTIGSITGLTSAKSQGVHIRLKVLTLGQSSKHHSKLSEAEAKVSTEAVVTPPIVRDTYPARRTELSVKIAGVDISGQVNQNLISLSYTDNEEDECDDLQIKLEDREGLWLQKWLNDIIQAAASTKTQLTNKGKTKGLAIIAKIAALDDAGVYHYTDCGYFELDSIKGSGFPSTITIKGTSLSYAGGIRTTDNDKAWVNYTLSGIAAEIAAKANLTVLFDAAIDPKYSRIEQEKETDLAFLMNLCHKAGYSLKIAFNQLIIYDQAAYEQAGESVTITYGDGSYEKWSVETRDGDVQYDICVVRYTNPSTGKKIEGKAYSEEYDEKDKEHETLTITNQKVSSVSEANALAEKMLRLRNKLECSAQFTLPGSRLLCAGCTVMLINFGAWNGKYIITKAKHEVSKSGYTTQITLRYPPGIKK